MSEVTTKQKLQDLLKDGIDRAKFDELTETIFSSYKNVDAANDYQKEIQGRLERAADADARDLLEQAGILAVAQGDFRTGVQYLQAVKARKEASHFLGRAFMHLGRIQEAAAALEAGRHGDEDFQTDVLLADLLCVQRNAEAARKLCARYEKSNGDHADWLYATGRVLETEGRYDEAMAAYEKAIERNPAHRRALLHLALNCDLNGEDGRAVELYERCAALQPTFVAALINLGVLYEDRANYEGAIECYKRVLAIDPGHERAQLFLKDAESSLTMRVDEEKTRRLRVHDEAMSLSLADFELSARGRSVLDKLNVRTLGDLTRVTEEQLLQFKNFGETSLEEIKDLLARNDLQLAGSTPPVRMLDLYEAEESEEEDDELPAMSVSELGLSTRSRKCMDRLQIQTVGELIHHTEDDLLSAPNFGRTSVAEVKSKLAELGLSLRSPEEGEEGEEPEEKLIEEHELIDDSAMKNLEDDEFEQ